ncbi:MAG TPA: hypothetical protein VF476_16095 [Chitinophagaceae bacterium]
MNQSGARRICLACGSGLQGRADKKFCNDYCRNNFNNEQKVKKGTAEVVRAINKILLNNRKILEGLLREGEEKITVNKHRLIQPGFQFKYFTHLYTTGAGKVYRYCYDYGYLELENDWILIVRKKERHKE